MGSLPLIDDFFPHGDQPHEIVSLKEFPLPMWLIISRAASFLLILTIAGVAAWSSGDWKDIPAAFLVCLLPLSLIWFPEEWGNYTGGIGHHYGSTSPTPPFLVCFMGWFLLVGLPLIIAWLSEHPALNEGSKIRF